MPELIGMQTVTVEIFDISTEQTQKTGIYPYHDSTLPENTIVNRDCSHQSEKWITVTMHGPNCMIWCFPEIGVPPVIIHFRLGLNLLSTKHFFILSFMEILKSPFKSHLKPIKSPFVDGGTPIYGNPHLAGFTSLKVLRWLLSFESPMAGFTPLVLRNIPHCRSVWWTCGAGAWYPDGSQFKTVEHKLVNSIMYIYIHIYIHTNIYIWI